MACKTPERDNFEEVIEEIPNEESEQFNQSASGEKPKGTGHARMACKTPKRNNFEEVIEEIPNEESERSPLSSEK